MNYITHFCGFLLSVLGWSLYGLWPSRGLGWISVEIVYAPKAIYSMNWKKGQAQGIQSTGSIHVIKRLTSGLFTVYVIWTHSNILTTL